MPEHAKFKLACRLKKLLRHAAASIASSFLAPSGAVAQGNKKMQERPSSSSGFHDSQFVYNSLALKFANFAHFLSDFGEFEPKYVNS